MLRHVAALLLISAPAAAHDAPLGWSYPFSCCSGYDCREVPAKKVGTRPEGYVIKNTGEVLAYSDTRLKPSPDGEFHWCSKQGRDDGETICLFVPQQNF